MYRTVSHSILFAVLGLSLFLVSSSIAFAQRESGDAVQVIQETELRKEPSPRSPVLGKLPKGTIATYLGDEKGGFVLVGVELQRGNVEGWVSASVLDSAAGGAGRRVERGDRADQDAEDDEDHKVVEEKPRRARELRPRTKITIPKDEGALLRREKSFLYGIYGGGTYSLMQDAYHDFNGPGFTGGGFFGIFLLKELPVRAEVGYSLVNGVGTGTMANTTLQFGFIDAALLASYIIDPIEIFAGARYAYGISLSNVPTEITVNGASDLSNFYGVVGVGYRISMGDVLTLILRARYDMNLMQAPVVIQAFSLSAALEFQG